MRKSRGHFVFLQSAPEASGPLFPEACQTVPMLTGTAIKGQAIIRSHSSLRMGCGQDGRAPGFGQRALKSTRRESFPCRPGAIELRRNFESPESLATRFPDALGDEDLGSDSFGWGEATDEPAPLRFAAPRPAREDRSSSDFAQTSARPTEMANCVTTQIGCCLRSAEVAPLQRSNS